MLNSNRGLFLYIVLILISGAGLGGADTRLILVSLLGACLLLVFGLTKGPKLALPALNVTVLCLFLACVLVLFHLLPLRSLWSSLDAGQGEIQGAMAVQEKLSEQDFFSAAEMGPLEDLFAEESAGDSTTASHALDASLANRVLAMAALFLTALMAAIHLLPRQRARQSEMVLAGFALFLVGVFLYLRSAWVNGESPVLWGPFNSNHRAQVLLLITPFLLSPLAGRWTRRTPMGQKFGLTIMAGSCLFLIALLMHLEDSRGALGALLGSSLLLVSAWLVLLVFPKNGGEVVGGRRVGLMLAPTVIATIAAISATPWILPNIRQAKIIAWGYCLQLLNGNPLSGVGPGQFPIRVTEVEAVFRDRTLEYGESSILQWAAETGWPGTLLLLVPVIWLAWSWLRRLGEIKIRSARRVFPFLCFAPGALLAASLEFGLSLPFNLLLLILFLVRTEGLLADAKHEETSGGPPVFAVLALLIAGTACLLSWKQGIERPSPERLTPYFRAAAVAPLHRGLEAWQDSEMLAKQHRLWALRRQLSGMAWGQGMALLSEGEFEQGKLWLSRASSMNPEPLGVLSLAENQFPGTFFADERQAVLAQLQPFEVLKDSGSFRAFSRYTFQVRFKSNHLETQKGEEGLTFLFDNKYFGEGISKGDNVYFPILAMVPPEQRIWIRLQGTWSARDRRPLVRVRHQSWGEEGHATITGASQWAADGDYENSDETEFWYTLKLSGSSQVEILDGLLLDLASMGGKGEVRGLDVHFQEP